ncbi:MAG: twin-arginine translocation signal domain-containing protein, partial [Ginsengibacter sp.]
MKQILKQLQESSREFERAEAARVQAEIDNPETKNERRQFLKKTAIGGITLAGMMGMSIGDTIAQTTSKVSRNSSPSDLKITDMR